MGNEAITTLHRHKKRPRHNSLGLFVCFGYIPNISFKYATGSLGWLQPSHISSLVSSSPLYLLHIHILYF